MNIIERAIREAAAESFRELATGLAVITLTILVIAGVKPTTLEIAMVASSLLIGRAAGGRRLTPVLLTISSRKRGGRRSNA
jgi:hypothetical protein